MRTLRDWDIMDYMALSLIVFNTIIFFPILFRGMWLFRQQQIRSQNMKNQDGDYGNVIRLRKPELIYAINALAIIINWTERVYLCLNEIWRVTESPEWTVDLCFDILWWAMMDLFAIKVYLLYYQQRHHMAISDQSWMKSVDPNYSNWFITHRETFGDFFYLVKICFIPYVLSVFLNTFVFSNAMSTPHTLWRDFGTLVLYGIPTGIAFFIYYRSRKVNDLYKIRVEIKLQIIILFVVEVLEAATFLYFHVKHRMDDATRARRARSERLIYFCLGEAVTFALTFIPIFFPLYLSQKAEKEYISKKMQNVINLQAPVLLDMPSRRKYVGVEGLNYTLRHYQAFRTFMKFVANEFCAENLLFVLELVCLYSYVVFWVLI